MLTIWICWPLPLPVVLMTFTASSASGLSESWGKYPCCIAKYGSGAIASPIYLLHFLILWSKKFLERCVLFLVLVIRMASITEYTNNIGRPVTQLWYEIHQKIYFLDLEVHCTSLEKGFLTFLYTNFLVTIE